MTPIRIPFNRPCFQGNETRYIAEAIAKGQISGNGEFTKRCQSFLEERLGVPKVLLTTSCTDALEMSAMLLGIQPGDEVIVPTFTFVSTVNAFVRQGAVPVFADIRRDTLNLDQSSLERLATSRTKAVVPVHYAGVGCEMDAIGEFARRRGIAVVEDNAHGLGAQYRDRNLGTFGSLATQSFHETKNFTCGEGGALLINDKNLIPRAEVIWEKGTNRSRFFRGEVDKYTWVDTGSSYAPSDVLAAFLLAQLEAWERVQSRRRAIWEAYESGLRDWAARHDVRLPSVPGHCRQSYHMFYLILPSLDARQRLIAHLRSRGILSVFHYVPLHTSEMGLRLGGKQGACPVAEDLSDRLVRLPFYNDLTEQDQEFVIRTVLEI